MENQRSIQNANFDLVNTYFGIDAVHAYDGIYVTLSAQQVWQTSKTLAC